MMATQSALPSPSRRQVLAAMSGLVAGLGAGPLGATQRQTSDDYVDRWVHPDLRPIARVLMATARGEPPLSLATLQARRRLLAGPDTPPVASTPFEARRIAGLGGGPPVDLFLVNAQAGQGRPAILNMHGGGFVSGTARAGIPVLADLCRELDCVGVTVEYRLAPETNWRGAVDDNYAALKWLYDHAGALGVDRSRIALLGDSAGGGHAALLALRARERGEVPVAFQCLIYPMLDDRTGSSRPVPPHVGRIIWGAGDNRFGWRSFLGTEPGGRQVSADAVPARVGDLRGLPPAFIGVGSLDLFHDEDVDYARRLNASGVATELIVVPGAFHAFDLMPAAVSRWFNAAKVEALRRALRPLPPTASAP